MDELLVQQPCLVPLCLSSAILGTCCHRRHLHSGHVKQMENGLDPSQPVSVSVLHICPISSANELFNTKHEIFFNFMVPFIDFFPVFPCTSGHLSDFCWSDSDMEKKSLKCLKKFMLLTRIISE